VSAIQHSQASGMEVTRNRLIYMSQATSQRLRHVMNPTPVA